MTRGTTPGTTDGLLLVDKPAGVSSHDVVLIARRALGDKRIGHAGTLDPFATGLLVLLTGRATRLAQHIIDEPKVYVADVTFGAETDTEDPFGTVTRKAPLPTRAALDTVRAQFVGRIAQVPPAFSAKHVAGKRAYELAREGKPPELEPVEVDVRSLVIETADGADGLVATCRIRVSCGGGTYIRSLARDLARAADSAAHLTTLRRERAGEFDVARAVSLQRLKEGDGALAPPLEALQGYPVQPLTEEEVGKIVRGIDVEARVDGRLAALIEPGDAGKLVAFAERRSSERGDRWQPRVVMSAPT